MRRVILAIVSTLTGLILLLSFKTHGEAALAVAPARSTTSTSTSTSDPGSASSGAGTTATGTTATGTRTITGTAADTRYGPVQVQITVADGKLTNVTATEYPSQDPRDSQINSYAIPVLNQEAVTAQSASIDMVSGATYTSDGYLTSLQSALDQAGLS